MNQAVNSFIKLLQQGIEALFDLFRLAWTWSFGQIITILKSDWQSLPAWKIFVLAIVLIGIGFALYRVVVQLWGAAEQILKAFIGLLSVLVSVLPYIVVAGLIAAGGAWVISNINI